MKVLVCCGSYPTNGGYVGSMFVHVRCKYYLEQGIDVCVVSRAAKDNYIIDGIQVYTVYYFENKMKETEFDIGAAHAPVHAFQLPFFEKHREKIKKIVLFFHGFEVLNVNKIYPKPYKFLRRGVIRDSLHRLKRGVNDIIKFREMRNFIKRNIAKIQLVFVSKWLCNEFKKSIKVDPRSNGNAHVIHNGIGKCFQEHDYDNSEVKNYDFIAVRSDLDGSKYCVDLTCDLALKYPNYKFLIIGNGKFFDYYSKPDNVDFIKGSMHHERILEYCQLAKCALMLTRQDTQGVMTCEMATLGMPVITSDIKVLHEIFDGFENVALVPNDINKIDLESVYNEIVLKANPKKNEKYFEKNTTDKEIELFRKLIDNE